MNSRNKGISVVIPVYNSEQTLVALHKRLNSVCTKLAGEFEIIFVNDGSVDNSWEEIKILEEKNLSVVGVNLMKNFGQHNALLCGIRKAKYELIATLDDDLQNPPEELPKLIEKLNEDFDVVYGKPDKEQHGLFRNISSVITKIALKTTMGVENAKNVSAFRVFRTQLREAFKQYSGSFISIDVLLTWGTNRFTAVPVKIDDRQFGRSNYTFSKLFVHALNMITGFSVLPLQIASMLGFIFAFFGLSILIYVIVQYLLVGTPVQGFPFLASIISVFSGVQLLAIGIIGEYLARMYFRAIDKPQYVELDVEKGN